VSGATWYDTVLVAATKKPKVLTAEEALGDPEDLATAIEEFVDAVANMTAEKNQ
jgi:hypothetical protein